MAKDLAKELVKAMNDISRVISELHVMIDFPNTTKEIPKVKKRLESALKRLNKIAAFYKIQ